MFKAGEKVYFGIWLEDGSWFESSPRFNHQVKKIEWIHKTEGDTYVLNLSDCKYTLALKEEASALVGFALSKDSQPTEENLKEEQYRAFVTKDYMMYAHQIALYFKRQVAKAKRQYEKDKTSWGGNEWRYLRAIDVYRSFIYRLRDTDYPDLFPEDYI